MLWLGYKLMNQTKMLFFNEMDEQENDNLHS